MLFMLLLAACGGRDTPGTPGVAADPTGSSPPAASPDPAPPAASLPSPVVIPPPSGPPGAAGLVSNFGSSKLQIAAGDGLWFIDAPAAGESTIGGLVMVSDGRTNPPLAPAPPDTVVTLNGVTLARALVNGAPSDQFFTVDPAGPQPTIGDDGYLHLTATSASLGATRTLNLPCPFPVGVGSSPGAGSSLSGAASVTLDWAAPLPTAQPLGPAFPTVSLLALDPASGAVAAVVDARPVSQGALQATLTVHPRPAGSAYVAEARYPHDGIFFFDGNTGGYCGRTTRIAFAP